MAERRFPITRSGLQKLEVELAKLRIARYDVAGEINDARGHGDLSENAEYHAAKEKSAMLDAKIQQLIERISQADVIDIDLLSNDKVTFGSLVTIRLLRDPPDESPDVFRYRIAGDFEADISSSIISVSSPMARAMIGKSVGDIFEVKTPAQLRTYEILEISV